MFDLPFTLNWIRNLIVVFRSIRRHFIWSSNSFCGSKNYIHISLVCLKHTTKKTCTNSRGFSQFRTFYYCCTIYTSTYNFECINFHIIFFFKLVWMNVWCGERERRWHMGWKYWPQLPWMQTWELYFLNFFLFIFFSTWPKKTGLQVHPTTDMQFTESREDEETEWTRAKTLPSLCLCYGFECGEENAARRADETKKRWNGWDERIYI